MFEEFGILYRGLILGVMIAAPVGPIGILVIRRTVKSGALIGFATGCGAAIADAIFAAIAAFGVAQITEWIHEYNNSLHIIGGLFLSAVAVHTWRDPPKPFKKGDVAEADVVTAGSVIKACVSGLVITLTNPVTLFATLALIATFTELHNSWESLTLVGGIVIGGLAWWFLLASGIALIRHHFNENTVRTINHITAVLLAGIAVWAIAVGVMGAMGLAF